MKHLGRPIFALALLSLLPLLGCDPPPPEEEEVTIEELFPADNEVGSWVEDTSKGQAGVEVFGSYDEAWAEVNGDAASFEQDMVSFAREFYVDGSSTLDLRIWQLTDASACQTIYDQLVIDDTLYNSNSWTDLSLGEAGRFSDTGMQWWHNCRKGAFHVESKIAPNDADGQAAAETFLEAVLAKIP